ncbi:hypothetical protein K435DRAFT_488427 [Dendrothele bispora CBS 962.96]|uniref:Uncharacterized protein n=1 Tax=Dendrothele bispora (strain CBS 962.96) TaxID=1314807 RepID=A0A4S8MC59_DENBC|nr:hypothetical protein K435DRAFT_488427 [Dendrothele bispora CBS 962.96]
MRLLGDSCVVGVSPPSTNPSTKSPYIPIFTNQHWTTNPTRVQPHHLPSTSTTPAHLLMYNTMLITPAGEFAYERRVHLGLEYYDPKLFSELFS